VLEGEDIKDVVKSYTEMKDKIKISFLVPALHGALYVKSVHSEQQDLNAVNQSYNFMHKQNLA